LSYIQKEDYSMRRVLIAMIAVGLLAGGASAQTKLAAFVGYGQSAFEDQDDAAGYIPIGVQGLLELSPGLSAGVELNLAVVPFTWTYEDFEDSETKVTQTVIAALAKYEIGQGRMRPHVRGGVGMYMGKLEYVDDPFFGDAEEDYKSAIGFNFGGGVTADWGYDRFWLAEFVYHVVSRELDVEGADSFGANNWALQLGAGMKF
jgi:hypothetical protein